MKTTINRHGWRCNQALGGVFAPRKLLCIITAGMLLLCTVSCKGKGGESSGSAASSSANATAAAPAASSSLGSNTVDSFIADYEKFVDDYSAAMQKVLAGDLAAAADLEKYVPLFESWQKQLENYTESDFTPEQARKIEELTNKLTANMGF